MARDRTYVPQSPTKKNQITQEQIDRIREDEKGAQALLSNQFFVAYCEQAKSDILLLHAQQLVYDATESTEQNGVKRELRIPAQKEYNMLAGEYRFVTRLFTELEQAVLICQEMEEKIKSEELEVIPEE